MKQGAAALKVPREMETTACWAGAGRESAVLMKALCSTSSVSAPPPAGTRRIRWRRISSPERGGQLCVATYISWTLLAASGYKDFLEWVVESLESCMAISLTWTALLLKDYQR
jgi:hypothetical protein